MAETYQGKAKKPTENKVTKCGDFAKISEVSISKLRKKITDIAKGEEKKWRKSDDIGKMTPKHMDDKNFAQASFYGKYEGAKLLALLQNYYRYTTSDNYKEALEDADDGSWSATFITFVLCRALEETCLIKKTDDSFKATYDSILDIYNRTGFFPSFRHITYIALSIYNRTYAKSLLFKYLEIKKVIKMEDGQIVCSIEKGDIICFPRWLNGSSQKKIDEYEFKNNYDEIIKKSLTEKKAETIINKIMGTTHTDIVVKKNIDHEKKIVRLETLGGNTTDSYLDIANTVGRKIWIFHFNNGKLESFKVKKYNKDKENWLDQPRTKFTDKDNETKGKDGKHQAQLNTIKGIIKIG